MSKKRQKTPGRTEFNRGSRQHMSTIKSRSGPLGGAPEVRIPPLDAHPLTGSKGEPLTMHQQAEALQDPTNPNSPMYDPTLADLADRQAVGELQQSVMDPNPQPTQARRSAGPFGGIGGPTLPPEAQSDPRFVSGVGSAYAANQPHSAFKGQETQRGRKALSEETVEGLEALKKFQGDAQQTQEAQSEEATKKDLDETIDANDVEPLKELGIENPEEFFSQFRQQLDDLSTPEIKESIEGRCGEMSLEQMLEEGEIRQEVPIVRGKFQTTFRTLSGEESLSIKREMFGVSGGDVYVNELLSMYQLTAGLFSINGSPLPTHLDDKKRFDKERFRAKFRRVASFPLPMLASMSINFQWFDHRSRKLFVDLDSLKNG